MKAFDRLKELFNSRIAHTFIMHGATFDYAEGHKLLKTYLNERFSSMANPKKVPIYYDRAAGVTFPTKSDQEAFNNVVGDMLADFGGVIPKNPADAFPIIGKALKTGHFALVIDYAESVFPDGEMAQLQDGDRIAAVSLMKWAKDDEDIRNLRNPIILITSGLSRINRMLREPSARIEAVGIPYPDPTERLAFIKETITAAKKEGNGIKFDNDMTPDFMSRVTAGLGKVHIIDIIMRARFQKQPITLDLVKQRKDDIIKAEFQEVLQVVDPRFGFDMIGGYEYIKKYFRKVIKAVREGNILATPMGILLMGPAGTGKSAFAEALAYECGVNFVRFNISRLFDRWVGGTEEKLEKALWAIQSIRPVIVFVDEIDTAMPSRNGHMHEVTGRAMKGLLEFMGDTSHRGEIIFLAATNRPDDIDFALRRTGRLDRKIPVLPPSLEDVPEIYMTMFRKHGIRHSLSAESFKGLNSGTWDQSTMVGSDIEAITLKAFEISEDSGKGEVDLDCITEAVKLIKPSQQDTAAMVASALRECNDLSLLPDAHRQKVMNPAAAQVAADGAYL